MSVEDTQSLDLERLFNEGNLSKERPFRTLLSIYRGHYGKLLLSLLFFIIKHSPIWVIPIVLANMINIASDPESHSLTEVWINLIVLLVFIIQNIPNQVFHINFTSRATRQVEASLRSTLVRKLQHLSVSYHSELRSGKLQAKVLRDVEAIEFLSKQIIVSFIPALANIIFAISYVASKNLWMVSFFVFVTPIAVLIVYAFRKKLSLRNRQFRTEIETMSGEVAETMEMIPVTRAHGLEAVEIAKIEATLRNLKGKGYKLDITEAFFGSSGFVVFQSFQAICLGLTTYLAFNGKISVGDIALFQGLFATILMSISQIINVYPQIAKGFESIRSVSEILLSNETEEYSGNHKFKKIKGSLNFENVYFHYRDTDKHVLRKFNLEVKPGECIAFVGESGAGKSTVLNLVIGFYRPTEGRILIDGIPMDDIDIQKFRQKLAVVPQNTILFSGSIRENITYGLTHITDEQVQHVIKMANLQDVIRDLPDGIETKIGEHGGKLSGGQRQRIAIARALIRDPQIIILDEATSALDNISEFQVQKAMRELIHGRTTFIVAHRLSTIRDADRIVVMKQGVCVEVGSYEELMERKGEFYQLKQMQA
ncbi:MAG: ABC transporter ATP-binding protein [Paenibacillaceae bacterium]